MTPAPLRPADPLALRAAYARALRLAGLAARLQASAVSALYSSPRPASAATRNRSRLAVSAYARASAALVSASAACPPFLPAPALAILSPR